MCNNININLDGSIVSLYTNKNSLKNGCIALEDYISQNNYQRTTAFDYKNTGDDGNNVEIFCNIIKLTGWDSSRKTKEKIDIKFENDPEVIGKWEIIDEYPAKECFMSELEPKIVTINESGKKFKEIYFLPNGQNYWIYGWTKGFIINHNGDYTSVNPYKIETINGEKYMFADWKSYAYMCGGKETVLVLKQIDNKEYTLNEISRTDDIDKPFIDDKKVLGKWRAVAYLEHKNEYFNLDNSKTNLFFKYTEFKENGICENIYGEDNRKVTSPYINWTKNYMLCKSYNGTENVAEKYEIKVIDGKEYLFIEWKSGDYIWGGWEPTYYVFVRDF